MKRVAGHGSCGTGDVGADGPQAPRGHHPAALGALPLPERILSGSVEPRVRHGPAPAVYVIIQSDPGSLKPQERSDSRRENRFFVFFVIL